MRAHVPLGFDTTAPIACVSSHLQEVDSVVVYVPSETHPKGEDALRSFEAYLNAVGKEHEVVRINPCSSKALFEFALKMDEENLICGGSGLRAFGLELLLACLMTKSKCLLDVRYEGGGKCLELRAEEVMFAKNREEALAFAYLVARGEATLEEVSDALKASKKSVWRVLNELVEMGFVRKVKRGTYAPSSRQR